MARNALEIYFSFYLQKASILFYRFFSAHLRNSYFFLVEYCHRRLPSGIIFVLLNYAQTYYSSISIQHLFYLTTSRVGECRKRSYLLYTIH